jgi:hypothetical protein
MPAVIHSPTTQDVGGNLGEYSTHGAVHGAKQADEGLLIDGLRFNPSSGTTFFGVFPNPATSEEIVIESATGGSAEYGLAGLQMNIIPRSGGNRYSGTGLVNYAGTALEGNNLTPALQAAGLTTINKVINVYDMNGAVGGPISRDKLWFFTAHRRWGTSSQYPNFYRNLTQGTNLYTPAASPTLPVEVARSDNLRLTWQNTTKQKLMFYYDRQSSCDCPNNETTLVSPEATSPVSRGPIGLAQVTWTYTPTNRLLIEGGFSQLQFQYSKLYPSGVNPATDPSITETTTGFTFGAPPSILNQSENDQYNARASMSYVTGSHHYKVGFSIFEGGPNNTTTRTDGGLTYTFRSGVPISLTEFVSPIGTNPINWPAYGLFAQDQWTIKRLTVNYGLRFDNNSEYVAAQHHQAVPQFGIAARNFPRVNCVPCWKDYNPRLAAVYDLLGTGKTALKASISRYVVAESTTIAAANDPINASINSVTRPWTPTNAPVNGLYVPNCDLTNPNPNGDCGPISNVNFGQPHVTTVYDPNILNGWEKRPYDWVSSLGIEQQLTQGVGLSATYYRTWYGNFFVTQNLATNPSEYSPYCITTPVDPRLPGGGNQQICGLYDLNPTGPDGQSLVGQVNNFVTSSSKFGNQYEVYNGVDLSIRARFVHGGLVSGGVNIGDQNIGVVNLISAGLGIAGTAVSHANHCFVVNNPGELYQCDVAPPYVTQLKISASYTLPWDVQVGANVQSIPGPVYAASYPATTQQIAPSLGRPLSGGVRQVTIQIMPPFSQLGPRINQTDIRVAKGFHVGQVRIQGLFDVYNLLNSSAVLLNNINYGPNWLQPTTILNGRLVKFGLQTSF